MRLQDNKAWIFHTDDGGGGGGWMNPAHIYKGIAESGTSKRDSNSIILKRRTEIWVAHAAQDISTMGKQGIDAETGNTDWGRIPLASENKLGYPSDHLTVAWTGREGRAYLIH